MKAQNRVDGIKHPQNEDYPSLYDNGNGLTVLALTPTLNVVITPDEENSLGVYSGDIGELNRYPIGCAAVIVQR